MPKTYGNIEIWGDLLVTGSFSILGSASSISTTSLVVSDTIIAIGTSQSGSPILDEGLLFSRGNGMTQAFIWDESDDTFALIQTDSNESVIGDVNIIGYSDLKLDHLDAESIKISGGQQDYILISDSLGNASWTSSIPGTSGTSGINGTTGVSGTSGTSGINGTTGVSGTSGTSGENGNTGESGTSGTSGNGTSGSSGTSGGFNYLGTYDSLSVYDTNDVVEFNGSSYVSIIDSNVGFNPETDPEWSLIASKGSSGTSGISGTSGTSGISGTNGTSGTSGIAGTSGTRGTSGVNGTSGTRGTSGTSGLSGSDGSNTGRWSFDQSATLPSISNPAATSFSSNSLTLSLITQININNIASGSVNYSNWLLAAKSSYDSGRTVYIQITELLTNTILGIWTLNSSPFVYGSGVSFYLTNVIGNGTLTNSRTYTISWIDSGSNAGLTGSGTNFYHPRWTSSNTLSSTSSIYDNGSSVGIGTITPTAKLNISDNSSSDLLKLTQTGTGNVLVVEDSTSPDASAFTINASGSVTIGSSNLYTSGIGGVQPKLVVSEGSSGVGLTGLGISTPIIFESNTTNSIGIFSPDSSIAQIYFGTPTDAFGSFIRWDYTNRNLIISNANSTGKLVFQTANGVEAARIDQNGNFGISTTSPTYKLEVSGSFSAGNQYQNGGVRKKINNFAGNSYSITIDDNIVVATPGGDFATYSLPVSPAFGTEITILKQQSGTVSIIRSGSDTIAYGNFSSQTQITWNPGVYGIIRFIYNGFWLADL